MTADTSPPELVDRRSLQTHRRLLLTFTAVLVAHHAIGAEVSSRFGVQGALITFDESKTWLLWVAAWLAWCWSLWRYWQHARLFADHPYQTARLIALNNAARDAVEQALRAEVGKGTYAARDLLPGDPFVIFIKGMPEQASFFRRSEWPFLNIELTRLETPRYPMRFEIKGGANCTLDARDTARVRRQVERAMAAKHPHFADWRIPYFLASLAPIAGLCDVMPRLVCIAQQALV